MLTDERGRETGRVCVRVCMCVRREEKISKEEELRERRDPSTGWDLEKKNPQQGAVLLTSGSPGKTMKNGQTEEETRCCQSSSGETGGPSDRWTPAPETDALPPDCSDHGNPSST